MRYAIITLGALLAAVLVSVVIGWALPVAHVASRSVQLASPPDSVFALISTPENYPAWRDVKKVEVTTEQGVTRFREGGSNGPILFEIPRRFRRGGSSRGLPTSRCPLADAGSTR